jgi:hypothetical protein
LFSICGKLFSVDVVCFQIHNFFRLFCFFDLVLGRDQSSVVRDQLSVVRDQQRLWFGLFWHSWLHCALSEDNYSQENFGQWTVDGGQWAMDRDETGAGWLGMGAVG